jgi:hypothetical protein
MLWLLVTRCVLGSGDKISFLLFYGYYPLRGVGYAHGMSGAPLTCCSGHVRLGLACLCLQFTNLLFRLHVEIQRRSLHT